MAIRTELSLRLPNSPGALAGVSKALAAEHINFQAMSLDSGGTLRLVVDNPVHAAGVLREQHYHLDEHDVLFTTAPNDPASISRVLGLLASAGVNIDYAYASMIESDRAIGLVIGVADPQRAAALSGL